MTLDVSQPDRITSDVTTHVAGLIDGQGDEWCVTWLPRRWDLTRNQAIYAMSIADVLPGQLDIHNPRAHSAA